MKRAVQKLQPPMIGDLVYVQQGVLGVVIDQKDNQLITLKNDGHIIKHPSNQVTYNSGKWAFRNKIKQEISSPTILPETKVLLEKQGIPSFVSGHLNALQSATETKKSSFSKKLSLAHQKLIQKNIHLVSLREICKLMSGFDDTTPSEELAAMALLKEGLYFKMVFPIVDSQNPQYYVRPEQKVKVLENVLAQMVGSRSDEQLKAFVGKAKKIIQSHRNGEKLELEFNDFDSDMIEIMKEALNVPKHISVIEFKIAQVGVMKRLGFYSYMPTDFDLLLCLHEMGVFANTEDVALHQYSSLGRYGELEGISDVGDHVVQEAWEHGKMLLSQVKGEETKEKFQVKVVKPTAAKVKNYKSQLLTKPIFSEQYHVKDPLESKRVEHSLPVYAIDSATAHEIDDGVSLEETSDGSWVHVHIADPTAFIPPDSALAQLAELRGNSIYLAPRHFPLMPDFLSNDLFNLGISPFAITFSAKIDTKGNITDYKVVPSKLKDVRQTTYNAVNTALDWNDVVHGAPFWAQKQLEKRNLPRDPSFNDSDSQNLQKLQEIILQHQRNRLKENGLIPDQFNLMVYLKNVPAELSPRRPQKSFDGPAFTQDCTIEIDPNSIPQRSPAHILVSESMIIAGRVAAKFFQERKIPVSYRAQLSPVQNAKLNNPFQHPLTDEIMTKVLAKRDPINGISSWHDFSELMPMMPPAYMSEQANGHANMGIPGFESGQEFTGYVKVTSPLRRYQDMLGHYQIQHHLLNRPLWFTAPQVVEISNRMNLLHKKERMLSRSSERYWVLEYLLRKSFNPSDSYTAEAPKHRKFVFEYKDNPDQIPLLGYPVKKVSKYGENLPFVAIPELGGLLCRYIPKYESMFEEPEECIQVVVEKVDPLRNFCLFKQI